MELETHLEVAMRLQYMTPTAQPTIQTLLARVGMMLNRLIRALKNKA